MSQWHWIQISVMAIVVWASPKMAVMPVVLGAENGPVSPGAAEALPNFDGNEQVQKILELVRAGDTDGYVALIHPSGKKLVNQDHVSHVFQRINDLLGSEQSTDWSRFSDEGTSQNPVIAGPVNFERGSANCRFIFGGEQLVGFTIQSDTIFFSTLTALNHSEIADHGDKFWLHLFRGEAKQGYELLSPLFRNQLSLENFSNMVQGLNSFAKIGVKKIHHDGVQFSAASPRNRPVMVSACYLIELQNTTYQPAIATYAINDDGDFDLHSFNTDFDLSYPVEDDALLQSFLRALDSNDVESVVRLLYPTEREDVARENLQALMKHVRDQLGSFQKVDEPMQIIRNYVKEEGGSARRTESHAQAVFDKATVPIHTQHGFGWLNNFTFNTKLLSGWTAKITDTTRFQDQGKKFLERWLSKDTESAYALMSSEFRSQFSLEDLEGLQETVINRIGKLKSIEYVSDEFIDNGIELQVHYKVTCEDMETTGIVSFEVNAFGGDLNAFNVSLSKPED